MTMNELRYAREGREYWFQYVRLNGYAWEPTDSGLRVLSRNLDLNIPYLRKCIHAYLSA